MLRFQPINRTIYTCYFEYDSSFSAYKYNDINTCYFEYDASFSAYTYNDLYMIF